MNPRYPAGEHARRAGRCLLPAPTLRGVDLTGVVAAVAAGAVAGAGGVLALRPGHGGHPAQPAADADPLPPAQAPVPADALPPARALIAALPVAVVVLDPADEAVLVNPVAAALGVLGDNGLPVAELRALVRETRRTGVPREADIALRGVHSDVRVRFAPLRDGHVALVVEDVTEARRVEAVRRDFVANVSHELKTPVGAMQLLAEALLGASEEPQAVRRFADRVHHEAGRLGRLVQELLDLSRLQGADPLPDPEPVALDEVLAEAVDRSRTTAAARGIDVVRGGLGGQWVLGSESQLVTAVGNLVENAVAYSPDHTRVALAVRPAGAQVEVSVTDQGIGIAEKDLERVFERFYRSDPARSRATGGTGLGLAIVKHVATNHGGEVLVWSVEGSGSTFTLRLPAAPVPVPGRDST
jgi:two-component system sensor histidine kinase SenX3